MQNPALRHLGAQYKRVSHLVINVLRDMHRLSSILRSNRFDRWVKLFKRSTLCKAIRAQIDFKRLGRKIGQSTSSTIKGTLYLLNILCSVRVSLNQR